MALPTPADLGSFIYTTIFKPFQSGKSGIDFQPTFEWVINNWATIAGYLLDKVIPLSDTQTLAKISFISALPLNAQTQDSIPLLQNAFHAHAVTLATGMTVSNYTGVAPPTLPNIISLLPNNDSLAFCSDLALLLITWAKTGTAIPLVSGPTINWS